MAKIKHTKNELKTQRDALKRFRRYLPTLLLKKQQLQMELRQLEQAMEALRTETTRLREGLSSWARLLAEPADFGAWLRTEELVTSTGNIAGVSIPVFQDMRFRTEVPDLFATPPWVDDALTVLKRLARLGAENAVLQEQHRRLSEELRTTSQRVNLFEKVKIPECEQNIRVIRIFLGDVQTAEVARSKVAKRLGAARVEAP